jgi:hypothetical protein
LCGNDRSATDVKCGFSVSGDRIYVAILGKSGLTISRGLRRTMLRTYKRKVVNAFTTNDGVESFPQAPPVAKKDSLVRPYQALHPSNNPSLERAFQAG